MPLPFTPLTTLSVNVASFSRMHAGNVSQVRFQSSSLLSPDKAAERVRSIIASTKHTAAIALSISVVRRAMSEEEAHNDILQNEIPYVK